MDWSQQTVLVTGAGGFIGSHLTERLVALGARTRALVKYNSAGSWGWLDHSPVREYVEVIPGDIRDRDGVWHAVQRTDIVFHLAALIGIPYSYHTPLSYVRTNVEGTLNVLQTALDAGVRLLVHTSTSEVYGTARYVPIDEEHPLNGQSPYSASKIAAEKFAEAFHRSYGLPITIVRPFNTFGPRQSARAVIPTIVTQCLTASKVYLGNVNPTRDLNYVSEVVEAYIRIAESPTAIGRTLNIGSGREISISELASLIGTLLGKEVEIEYDEKRIRPEYSEVDRLVADNTAAREVLSWQPSISLEEGLKLTTEWIGEHLGGYRPHLYVI